MTEAHDYADWERLSVQSGTDKYYVVYSTPHGWSLVSEEGDPVPYSLLGTDLSQSDEAEALARANVWATAFARGFFLGQHSGKYSAQREMRAALGLPTDFPVSD